MGGQGAPGPLLARGATRNGAELGLGYTLTSLYQFPHLSSSPSASDKKPTHLSLCTSPLGSCLGPLAGQHSVIWEGMFISMGPMILDVYLHHLIEQV